MAILGLTDRAPGFPQIGVLRKGGPKQQREKNGRTYEISGQDLKHFRFDSEDEEASKAFEKEYGAEPRTIRVFVPFASTGENFEAWREEWDASSLRHRCDGRTCVRWLTKDGKYSHEPIPCPGNCKPAGRLKVIIPELRRLAYVLVHTSSIHDILEIDANLKALEATRGDLRGIPLNLKRTPREISTPGEDGKRVRREKWLISIEAQPQWVDLQLAAQERAAMGAGSPPPQLALGAWEGDEDDEDEPIPQAVASSDSFPTRAAAPSAYRTQTPQNRQASAPAASAEARSEAEQINAALLRHCIDLKENERAGKAYFNALYGKLSAAERRQKAIELKLMPQAAAAEPVYEAEPVEEKPVEENRAVLIAQVEELIVSLHRAFGRDNAEITAQIARMAQGEVGLDDMDDATLKTVRDGLEFWRDTLKDEMSRAA